MVMFAQAEITFDFQQYYFSAHDLKHHFQMDALHDDSLSLSTVGSQQGTTNIIDNLQPVLRAEWRTKIRTLAWLSNLLLGSISETCLAQITDQITSRASRSGAHFAEQGYSV